MVLADAVLTSDHPEAGLYSALLMPSHRRELQTEVSTSAGLTSALANTAVGRIVLAPGTYALSAELSITRSVVLEAAVAGSVVLDAQARTGRHSGSDRRVMNINPGPSGVVQLIGLNITRGFVISQQDGGAGVRIQSGSVTVTSCSIYDNEAYFPDSGRYYGWGGGVYIDGGLGNHSFINCVFHFNDAANGGGVVIWRAGGSITFTSCSFFGNKAGADDGGGGGAGGGVLSRFNMLGMGQDLRFFQAAQ